MLLLLETTTTTGAYLIGMWKLQLVIEPDWQSDIKFSYKHESEAIAVLLRVAL